MNESTVESTVEVSELPSCARALGEGNAPLFAPPTRFAPDATQQRLLDLAQAEFEEIEIPAPVAPVPVDELRATLRKLAPAVRETAFCHFIGCDEYDTYGNCTSVDRCEVPALFAHFAFVALALVEAENAAQ
jgi:hypothetical protein